MESNDHLSVRVLMKIYDENFNRLNHIVKISHFPFSVGRSAQNDYIIDHPSISSQHFSFIEEEGCILMINHSMTNGLFVKGQKHERIVVSRPQMVMVGGVKVEVVSLLSERLDKTREIVLRDLLEREESPGETIAKALLAMAFFVFCLCLKRFFTDPLMVGGPWNFGKEILTGVFWILILTLAQALFCKLQTQDYQFLPLFKNISKAAGLLVLIKILLPLVCFYLEVDSFQNFIVVILNLIVVFYYFGRYLQMLFMRKFHQRIWATLSLLMVVYGLVQSLIMSGQDEWGENDYQGFVTYPGARFMQEQASFKDFQVDLNRSFKTLQAREGTEQVSEDN